MHEFPLLKQQCVRDLAWAVFAPNLIDDYAFHPLGTGIAGNHVPLTEQRSAWLTALDSDSGKLEAALRQRKSTRLGVYFEYLWQFFISEDPALTLLASNLPVYRNKTTLGEFDLLYRDEDNGDIIHLELAIKYYLNTLPDVISPGNSEPLSNWLGPNTRDRLDIKLHRLLSHQCRLTGFDEGQRILHEHEWDNAKPQIALKGFLFNQPATLTTEKSCYPLNPAYCHGYWLPISQFYTLAKTADYWTVLQRPYWISPAYIPQSERLDRIIPSEYLLEQLTPHFSGQGSRRPLMLCAMEEKENNFQEAARYMVTDNHWPLG